MKNSGMQICEREFSLFDIHKEQEKNKMLILRRDYVPDQGRKTECTEVHEYFPDEELVHKIEQNDNLFFDCS